ncbi:MAG TPA: pitrilysin family protein [Bryobacteraceae bacterium]|nr:pitrilysin family protein [Bryobacteraceae bacterium]
MRIQKVLLVLIAGALCAFPQTLPQGVEKKASLGGITEYDYANGLRVLLFPDPSSPKVTVNMTYLVGSRFEGYGETGMAHLLEHMNFILTTDGRNIKKELTDHGAQWNGTTDYDRTNYFETVTASDENLKWALGLEAERMVNMRIEKKLLDTEMTVVRNEFEQGENNPREILEERVIATAYLWHNYGKSVIGSRADIEKVPIDRLAAFYKKYYQPDNAVLVIAGQFDPSKALACVAGTVGAIPRPTRKLEPTYTVEPPQDGERFVALRRVGENPDIMIAWHAPALANPDSAALEVLDGVLAGGGRGGTGRLYHALVDNKKALSVNMDYEELHDPGFVMVSAGLSKDQSLDEARKAILDTVASIATEPPTKEEVDREKARILQGMQLRMSNSQMAALGLSEMIASGDWRLFFLNYDEIKKVTPEDVVRVAKFYFKESNRTVGEFIPTAAPDRTVVPPSSDLAAVFKDYQTSLKIEQGAAFDPTPANIEQHLTRLKLPDGLKLAMLPKTSRGGTVSAVLRIEFGDEKALEGMSAIGSMTGAMLMRGTKQHTRQQIQDELVKLDARISVSGNVSGANASIETTGANLIPALRLAAEILREPSFPDSEFESAKKQRIAGIEGRKTEPNALAPLALDRALDPFPKRDVRYIGTFDEQMDDANKVTLEDIKHFHSQFYGASHGELVIVGQFDPQAASKTAAELFGNWPSPAPYKRITEDFEKTTPVNLRIDTPDKQNAMFMAALHLPMSDTDPDYPAMVMANYMFGGSITARIPDRIRNREGLSYGVYSNFSAPEPDSGNTARFSAMAISNPKNSPKVEASFRDELAKTLAGGFTQAELDAAKKSIRDERKMGRSQDQGLLRLIEVREDAGRTLAWDEQLDAKLDALTLDQVNAAFRKHVDASSISIVKAGDFKAADVYQQ